MRDWLVIAAAIRFVLLFYHSLPGLNLILVSSPLLLFCPIIPSFSVLERIESTCPDAQAKPLSWDNIELK